MATRLRFSLGVFFAVMVAGGQAWAQTAEENAAAFAGAAGLTGLSYHWDAYVDNRPVVASSPRTTLPYASSLTTINYDPLNPALYQEKVIGGVTQECVLVGTFTNPNGFWDKPSGSEMTLTYSVGSTTHYIFPYVTVGSDLHSYLSATYFSSSAPTDAEVALRIDQSLGLDPSIVLNTRGLAFFWVPITNIVRSGYSPDVSQQVSGLSTYADGSYMPSEFGVDPSYRYVDVADNTVLYTTNEQFVEYNEAQTKYPWTAMGYTFNWNALQDGDNPAFGTDPLAPGSFMGLPEFMVSGGSQVVLDSWVPYAELDAWAVPEPGSFGLVIGGLVVWFLGWRMRRREEA